MGKDGDVSLHCRFMLAPRSTPGMVDVQVKWCHAQDTGIALVGE